MSETVNIICVKWGQKYGAEYVNRLRSMVSRHLTLPHRFVCFTDDPQGIQAGPDLEVYELPFVDFADFDNREPWAKAHGWLKVTSFADPLVDLKGTTLFLDLDIVIVDNINSLFSPEGEFHVINEWDKNDETGNTSVFRFQAGAHADLLDILKKEKTKILDTYRNEQEFVTHTLHRQGKLHYWPDGWCVSFKRHCLPGFPAQLFKAATIPQGAKIVTFHGKPYPEDAAAGRSGKWYRHVKPVQWITDNWR